MKFFFALAVDVVIVFFSILTCFAELTDIRTSLHRQKRLSVLSILYRKVTNDSTTVGTATTSTSTTTPAMEFIHTTTIPVEPERFTIAPAEITTAISRLRTTRGHFSMTSKSRPAIEPQTPFPLIPENTWEHTRLSPPDQFSGSRPGPHISPPKGQEGGGLAPADFVPFPPASNDQVTLTFLPSYPNNPRNSQPDQVKENPFYPATRGPVYNRDRPPFNGVPLAPALNGHPPVVSKHTENMNPVYHHLPPNPPLMPTPPSSGRSSVASTLERSPPSSSPNLQARLHINSNKKNHLVTPNRRETVPTMPPLTSPATTMTTPISTLVTGSPANLNCNGKIGYFSDQSPGCDVFLYCDQFGRSFRFLCPQGTQFNSRLCLCDMHSRCHNSVSPQDAADDPCPPLNVL